MKAPIDKIENRKNDTMPGDHSVVDILGVSITADMIRRFWEKVSVGQNDECWMWNGATRSGSGHGHLKWGDRYCAAHRVSYSLSVGQIPDGMVLDHLCRNPGCVNPSHLEPVKQRVNVIVRGVCPFAAKAKQTHCKRGHPLSGDNLGITVRGTRFCRNCNNMVQRRALRKKNGWPEHMLDLPVLSHVESGKISAEKRAKKREQNANTK